MYGRIKLGMLFLSLQGIYNSRQVFVIVFFSLAKLWG